MRRTGIILILGTALLATGCSYSIHEVHVSDFDGFAKTQGKIIRAEEEQFVIMGIVGDTNYVDEAYDALLSKCKGGRIQGITTQFSTAHGFFSWTNKILMQGLCVK